MNDYDLEHNEPQPELDELQQSHDYEVPALKVCVEGPVSVNRAPNRKATLTKFQLNAGATVRIANADPRRARIILMANDATATNYFLGTSHAEVSVGECVQAPVSDYAAGLFAPPLIMEHSEMLFARSNTGETVTLSVITENWAD